METSVSIYTSFKAMLSIVALGVSSIYTLSATAAPASGNATIKPIDPEIIAKKFKPGVFKTETLEISTDGKSEQKTEAMCMDAASANILANGVLWGVAGCQPLSTSEDESSISITANCPATGEMGANFYRGTIRWSADGKEIEWEGKRTAIEQGKPTDKVLNLVRAKLHYQSQSCKQ